MESKIPYQKLKNKKKKKKFIFSICFGKNDDAQEFSREDFMIKLGNKIKEIDMKCQNMEYQKRIATKDAKFCLKKGDIQKATALLQECKRKERDRKKFLNIWVKLRLVRDEIENSAVISNVVKNMDVANQILDKAMSEFSIDQIDDIMIGIETNVENMNDINSSLGKVEEIDVDFELQALEKEIAMEQQDNISLPDVPAKEKEEFVKNHKIKITEL